MTFGFDLSGHRPERPVQPPQLKKGHFVVGGIVALLVLVVAGSRTIAKIYTDYLWFDSVGFGSVWTGLLGTKILLAILAAALIGLFVWVNLWLAERAAPRSVNILNAQETGTDFSLYWRAMSTKRRGMLRTIASAAVALVIGAGFYVHWHEWLLFLNGGSFGEKDPIFHKDIGFFVFQLPFFSTAVNWLFGIVLMTIIITVIAHYLGGSIAAGGNKLQVSRFAKSHIAILVGTFALVRALQYYVERFELSFSQRSDQVSVGANYADVKFLLPALWLLILISIAAAVMFFVSARASSWGIALTTVALWGVVSLVIGTVIPAGVQRLIVKPAEATKELPYLQRNIDATRHAMGLNAITVHGFDYKANLTGEDLQSNAQTIRNIRLWDAEISKPSYQRLQETRSFFNFSDIDVDRYMMNGQTTQVMLSVRELNTTQLPSDKRSWVNERLQYTHGYGAVVSPANAVTSDGKPDFTLKDVPPVGSPQLTQPAVYFGEKASASHYSIVASGQPEIDYVSSTGKDETSTYQGAGGVPINNVIRRAALAMRVGEIEPLISSSVGKQSRAMYLTNITQRSRAAAPFLHFDADPYPVIMNGRILWVQDAYTTTDSFPYGTYGKTDTLEGMSGLKGAKFNYVRNSVKVVTDAYDGTMTFYVVDQKDPIIKSWQKSFPKLFTDGTKMSDELRSHLRYPEDLFRVQSQMFGEYHMKDAKTFYTKSDRWNIAQEPPRSPQGTNSRQQTLNTNGVATPQNEARIDPYYLLMRLPEDSRESFLLFQPFVPFSNQDQRKELSAFLTAKSDPAEYGKLDAYEMPRDQQIDGPALVDARINSEPNIARQVSLLNQQGSKVSYGDMLIVPVKSGLIYVRPLYVVASNTQVPELKSIIVVSGNKIAMEPTLSKALEDVFGSSPGTLEQGGNTGPGTGGAVTVPSAPGAPTPSSVPNATPAPSGSSSELLNKAKAEFDAADQALRSGDLAEYQRRVKAGIAFVDQARSG